MANQQGVIKKFMASLDTTTLSGAYAVDAAVKAGGYSAGLDPLILQILNDCVAYNDADPTDGWKNFLADKCGINLDNRDTGAITGADAGGSVIKTADSIVPEDGSLINFTGNSFTANGLTIQLASLDEGYYQGDLNFDDLTATEKYIWQALYTWWAKNSLDLIADSYGNNFSFTDSSSATVKKMYFGFYNKD